LYAVITHEILGIVVSNWTYSSGSARTTIDESAKATATATARASSKASGGVREVEPKVMAHSTPPGRAGVPRNLE
jgi:hypothetical protein